MKLLTKEEERAHYNETLKGGTLGGVAGLGIGAIGVWAASRRYHFIRTLTLPLKAFLVTSSGTFAGIIAADHWSRAYERDQNPYERVYQEREKERREAEVAGKTFTQRAMDFGKKERYKIVAGSWVASIAGAFAIVNRDKYLTGAQKIVQARVYAQFLTLGVLIASAAFEISDSRNQQGRYETVKYIDPNDPEHKRILEKQVEVEGGNGGEKDDRGGRDLWKDMVEAEEERIKEKEEEEKRWRKEADKKNGKKSSKKDDSKAENHETKKEKKDDSKGEANDAKKEKKDDSKDEGGKSKKEK